MPYVAFQLWRFITLGLKPGEKRYAIPFSLASTILFATGVAVAFTPCRQRSGSWSPSAAATWRSSSRPTATCALCCSWVGVRVDL